MLATSSKRRAQRSISPHRGNSACTRASPLPPMAICLWWDPCECQLRPRRGKIWALLPAAAPCRRKGKVSGSPGFAKLWADQRLDLPALFAVTAAPLAFGMIGDFPLRIAEEIPIPVSIQILTSSLVFQGGLPPVFRRIFALCPAFQRQVGYLPYPRGKSGTQGRQRLLLFLP